MPVALKETTMARMKTGRMRKLMGSGRGRGSAARYGLGRRRGRGRRY